MDAETRSRILQELAAHRAVTAVRAEPVCQETGTLAVAIDLRVDLPNAWRAAGASPNGVKAVEPVCLTFPAAYPLRPPRLELRADFDRSLAHVNPGPPDVPPVPCVYDGNLGELLLHQGLGRIVAQLADWLGKAAMEALIDPAQGWEPVRRDNLEHRLVADAAHLRGLVNRTGGWVAFGLAYLRHGAAPEARIDAVLGTERIALKSDLLLNRVGEQRFPGPEHWFGGRSIGLFFWPGKQADGTPFVAKCYQPETVVDLASLRARAEEYGCREALDTALNQLARASSGLPPRRSVPLVIVLGTRRPFHLIDSESPFELCPYLTEIAAPGLFPQGDATPVHPTAHLHAVTAALLRSLSGEDREAASVDWTLLGAGSLGSKIGLHLARRGRAPARVIDRAVLQPHNYARHGLTPASSTAEGILPRGKARALAEAIADLGQMARDEGLDFVDLVRDPQGLRGLSPKRFWALVNTTASLAVREALAGLAADALPRVVEAALYAQGRVGLLAVEGPDRSPSLGDLMTEAFAAMQADPRLRRLVFQEAAGLSRQPVGQGCGSATMPMPDARVSAMAAPMAETIARWQREGLPEAGGRLLLGALGDDGISLAWQSSEIAPWTDVKMEDDTGWRLRLSARVDKAIRSEVAAHPAVETGGVLVGRISAATRTFHVVDVLPAPEDSRRAPDIFVLGTKGLQRQLKAYAEESGGSLYCLGTWHSHLRDSGPSTQDLETAQRLGASRPTPFALLIRVPGGYRAVLASTERRLSETPKRQAP